MTIEEIQQLEEEVASAQFRLEEAKQEYLGERGVLPGAKVFHTIKKTYYYIHAANVWTVTGDVFLVLTKLTKDGRLPKRAIDASFASLADVVLVDDGVE